MRTLACIIIFVLSICWKITAQADTLVDYWFIDIANKSVQKLNLETLTYVKNKQLKRADATFTNMLKEAEIDPALDINSYARTLNNRAILQILLGEHDAASASLKQSVTLIDAYDPFHIDLYPMLMIQANIDLVENRYADSENALKRAQHILHRQDGVYSSRQLPLLNQLTMIYLNIGKPKLADHQQWLSFKTYEKVYGVNSKALVPKLTQIGAYFSDRYNNLSINFVDRNRTTPISLRGESSTIFSSKTTTDPDKNKIYHQLLFKESVRFYQRALDIITDKYGPHDIRLTEPLKGLSRIWQLQGSRRNRAKKLMQQATQIVIQDPATDVADHGRAMVELGDLYTVMRDKRAAETYLVAWRLLAQSPDHQALLDELFAEPQRLYPKNIEPPVLDHQPISVEADTELYISLQYNVRSDGRTTKVQILDSNLPNTVKRAARQYVLNMRFRPQMIAGELQPTEGLRFDQIFAVAKRQPSQRSDIK